MKDYFVKFFQEFEYDGMKYKKEQVILCTKSQAWKWAETSKEEDIKIVIYEAEIVCDLS